MKAKKNIAIVILAAGASRRLGEPKQLVQYQGEPLLRRMAKICQQADLGKTYVILGSNAELIAKSISDLDISICINPNWARGMGNTIAFAAREILLMKKYNGVCFVLSDQIHFEAKLLQHLIQAQAKSGKTIILSKYKNGQGPPSYFDESLFEELANLDGDDGAKAVVKNNKTQLGFIDFPLGAIDVDTAEDLNKLTREEGGSPFTQNNN